MGTIQDNNLPADGSKDQDEAIAAGLLAAAKKFFKERNAILFKAVNLFVDKLIAAAIQEQDPYLFILMEERARTVFDVDANVFYGRLRVFVKELLLNGELDVPPKSSFPPDYFRRKEPLNLKDFDLFDLWKSRDVFAVLEEILEEKVFGYLGKEETELLVGYPEIFR
jgi:hypothetical protein